MVDQIEQIEEELLLTATSFAKAIEDLVWELDCSYLEAIIEFCDRNALDPLDCTKLINKPLKEKIEFEAMADGLLKRPAQLPL